MKQQKNFQSSSPTPAVFSLEVNHTNGSELKPQYQDQSKIYSRNLNDEIPLPALIYVNPVNEDGLIKELFSPSLDLTRFGNFRLTPAFIIYMVSRHRLSPLSKYCSDSERNDTISRFVLKFADYIETTANNICSPEYLIFLLANTSEFLFMLHSDSKLDESSSSYTLHWDTNNLINTKIHERIESLVNLVLEKTVQHCCQLLIHFIPPLLTFSCAYSANNDLIATNPLLENLSDLMNLAKIYSVNSALIVHIFLRIFNHLNVYIFNWFMMTTEGKRHLSKRFGTLLKNRFGILGSWSEQQNLSIEPQMNGIRHLINLLVVPKNLEEMPNLSVSCYKLNSFQVNFILSNYICDPNELVPPAELIEQLISLAQNNVDKLILQCGQKIQLTETEIEPLFVFPKNGFRIDSLSGIPRDMLSYITFLQNRDVLGVLLPSTKVNPKRVWTGHMQANNIAPIKSYPNHTAIDANNSFLETAESAQAKQQNNPVVIKVSLQRTSKSSIGISIVEVSLPQRPGGIYVKKIIDGSLAQQDGRIERGDQLLSVNGISLVGMCQDDAADVFLRATGPIINLEIAKKAAFLMGIGKLFQLSPTISMTSTLLASDSLSNLHFCQQKSSNDWNWNHENQAHQRSHYLQSHPYGNNSQHSTLPKLPSHYRHATNRSSLSSLHPNIDCLENTNYTPINQTENFHRYAFPQTSTKNSVSPPLAAVNSARSPYGLSVKRLDSSSLQNRPVSFSSQHFDTQHMYFDPNLESQRLHFNMHNNIRMEYFDINESPMQNTCTTNSTGTNDDELVPNSNKHQRTQEHSGRSSAPIFGGFQHDSIRKVPQAMTIQQMNVELNRLSSLSRTLTDQEQRRYAQLMQHLSITKSIENVPPFKHIQKSDSKIGSAARPTIPYLTEMESRLEAGKNGEPILSSSSLRHSGSCGFNETETVKNLFDTVNEFSNQFEESFSLSESDRRQPPQVPPKPKKINQKLGEIAATKATEQEPCADNFLESLNNGEHHLHREESKIIGAQEVYMNDPRERRMKEFQTSQRSMQPVKTDASNLPFRDKMKLFASNKLNERKGAELAS